MTLFLLIMFLPHIIQQTRVSSNSETLIDNIFSNILSPNSVSGNLTGKISDHLPQIVIAPTSFSESPLRKSLINIDQESFIPDFLADDKNTFIKKSFVNLSFQDSLSKTNFILNNYAPKRKASKKSSNLTLNL